MKGRVSSKRMGRINAFTTAQEDAGEDEGAHSPNDHAGNQSIRDPEAENIDSESYDEPGHVFSLLFILIPTFQLGPGQGALRWTQLVVLPPLSPTV